MKKNEGMQSNLFSSWCVQKLRWSNKAFNKNENDSLRGSDIKCCKESKKLTCDFRRFDKISCKGLKGICNGNVRGY